MTDFHPHSSSAAGSDRRLVTGLSKRSTAGRPREGVVVLQRIRAGWKVIVGEGGSNHQTNDEAGDAFRYRPSEVGVEQSPCTAKCGCPASEWCSATSRSTLRIVPDLESGTADDRLSQRPRVAQTDRSDASMGDAGMSTVEYAVGTVVAAAFAAVLYKIVTGDSVVDGLTNLINTALSTSF
jgi:hypothetical protein